MEDLLGEVRHRLVGTHLGGALALGTDIGANRSENQDRVLGFQSFHPTFGPATFVAALADGMGGMVDGSECATLALRTFTEEFLQPGHGSLALKLTLSAAKANELVYERYKGRGGSTLSAIALSSDGSAVGLNVGDSRIYSSSAAGVSALTVDDTLSAAFGGEGQGLLQFIGLGPGLRSHLIEVPTSTHMLFLTSDGVHFPEKRTFAELLGRSPDPKSAAERSLALARWLGSPDNASIIAIVLDDVRARLGLNPSQVSALYGPTGSLVYAELPSPRPAPAHSKEQLKTAQQSDIADVKKRGRPSRKKKDKSPAQLKIDVGEV